MAKCVQCSQRKAKRHCPALGESICSLCCGTHRQKEIHCPPACAFLVKHKPYQDKRTLEKKHVGGPSPSPSEKDILSDERLAWLAFNIEVPIGRMVEKDSSMTDGDALSALDYARDKLEKESSLIIMSEKNIRPKNELGEAIFQGIEQCRYEKKIIVPGELQTYTQDEKTKCLDRVIFAVQQFSQGNMEGRGYLQQLIDRFSKISQLSRQQKLHIPD
jgi:hypothetical protein